MDTADPCSRRSSMRGLCPGRLPVWIVHLLCCLTVLFLIAAIGQAQVVPNLPPIVTHDNVHSGGELKDGVLTIRLEIREGAWHPNDDNGDYLPVYAFGEEGHPLSIPGPLIRVTEGTQV